MLPVGTSGQIRIAARHITWEVYAVSDPFMPDHYCTPGSRYTLVAEEIQSCIDACSLAELQRIPDDLRSLAASPDYQHYDPTGVIPAWWRRPEMHSDAQVGLTARTTLCRLSSQVEGPTFAPLMDYRDYEMEDEMGAAPYPVRTIALDCPGEGCLYIDLANVEQIYDLADEIESAITTAREQRI